MATIEFHESQSEPQPAIVVSFDLSGFSRFCNQADAHVNIPRFISRLFLELNKCWMGFLKSLVEKSDGTKIIEPQFIKFTGDGAILIWLESSPGKFDENFCTTLVMAMRDLQVRLNKVVPKWEKEWKAQRLPMRARFGLAFGYVYALFQPYSKMYANPIDYVGYCINLAVRLQDHCPEIGFLIHGTIHPKLKDLIRLTAVGMKGSMEEPTLAFSSDLALISPEHLKSKFKIDNN